MIRSRTPLAALGAAALIVAGGVWYFGLRGPAVALTERDTVLVADFVNTTGDPVFDDALRQAVAVQLQQTPFLTLMPDQRIVRTLRLMQRPPEQAVTGETAREACQRAGAKATVEGSIAPSGSGFAIAIGVHNCQTGESIAKEQVQASSKDVVLAQIGVAVKNLRRNLGESQTSIQKYDVPVTDAATPSLEALRAYGQGQRARVTRGDEAAIPFFTQAVDTDPNFALAYAKLGVVTGNSGRVDEARSYAAKAWEFRDKVSEYERLYLDWNYASRVLNDPAKVREALEMLVAAYPRDFAGRNNLGVYFNTAGDLEQALKHYLAASEIAPDEPGPISNAAYVLLQLGRVEEANAHVEKTLSIRPDGNLAVTRWVTATVNNLPRAAEYEQAARKFAGPDQMTMAEATLAGWRGQFKTYRRIQDDMLAKARAAGNEFIAKNVELGRAITLAAFLGGNDLDALRALAGSEKDPASKAQLVGALATLGDVGPARTHLADLTKASESNRAVVGPLAVARAYVLSSQGKADEALAEIQRAVALNPRAPDLHFFAGVILDQSGRIDDAAGAFRQVIQVGTSAGPNLVIPVSRLRLAKILLKKGDTAGAREQLDTLLAQWKDADTEFELLKEARALRAQIKA